MGDFQPDKQAGPERIVLAHEEAFSLCDLNVSPQTLQVEQNGRSSTLEPRVMQVLVALASAGGKIVTRDELIERCWDGRIVGEDAINRALSRVRHIAQEHGGDCFAIETIPRVGYRLTTAGSGLSDNGQLRRPLEDRVWSRRLVLGGVAGAAALAASAWAAWPPQSHEPLPSALKLFRFGIENRGQASLQQSEQSVSYLREAVRIDPEFAEAWGALAWGYRSLLVYGPHPDIARIESLSRSAARRALELEPDNADAHAALLLLKPFYGRWAEVEKGCRNLLLIHPNHSILQFNLGTLLCDTGRWREAIPSLAAVAEREQFWPLASFQLFQALMPAGRVEEAEDLLDRAFKRWPRRTDFWIARHRLLVTTNQNAKALAFANDLSLRPVGKERAIDMELLLATALDSRSDSDKEVAVDKLVEHAAIEPIAFVFYAIAIGMLGSADTSFDMLDGFFFGRGRWAKARPDRPNTAFLFSVSAAPLRAHPRFGRLVDEIGLERFWADQGVLPDYRRFQ